MPAQIKERGSWGLPGTGDSMQGLHQYTSQTDSLPNMLNSGYFNIFADRFNKNDLIAATSINETVILTVDTEKGTTPVEVSVIAQKSLTGRTLTDGAILVGNSQNKSVELDYSFLDKVLIGQGSGNLPALGKIGANNLDSNSVRAYPVISTKIDLAGGTTTYVVGVIGLLATDNVVVSLQLQTTGGAFITSHPTIDGQITLNFNTNPGDFTVVLVAFRDVPL